ncbi:MAG: sigma-70 family RNA polymerase sigma factor [Candidatus Dormibacteraeota bacterium]|nr:sigma-70 family RNA polymerase sigma factor [Candidatus Dormibacteraeota bacterium]
MLHTAVTGSITADLAPAAPTARRTASECDGIGDMYDRYGALAFSLAYRVVRDRGVAEDVVQESFLALWKNADRYDPSRASMRSWLCRIVRNRAIDRLRGTSGRQRNDHSLDDLTSLPSSADVLSDVLRREETRTIVVALAALPPAQRETIELAYYGGYSQTEIATMTAAPLGTVKGRTRLAMRALALALAPMRA